MLFNDLSVNREALPLTIPVFPLSEALLLPGIDLPLNIYEPRYMKMVDDSLADKRLIGIIQPQKKKVFNLSRKEPLSNIGCAGRIKTFSETEDGRYIIVLQGVTRFETVEEIDSIRGYRRFKVNYDNFEDDFNIRDVRENFKLSIPKKELVKKLDVYLKQFEEFNGIDDLKVLMSVESGFLVDFLCSYLQFAPNEKQLFLEAKTLEERAKMLYSILGIAEAEKKLPSANVITIH